MGKLLNEKKLYVSSPKKVTINNIEISGAKPRQQVGKVGRNSTILFDTTELVINGATLKNDLSCYNVIEQSYGAAAKQLKNVIVKDLVLNAQSTNNIVSMYNFANGANITFKNCVFELCDGSNALRVDNLSDCHNVLITFDNCTWQFKSTSTYGKDWDALMIMQDSKHSTAPQFNDWKIVIKNCVFGEEAITPHSFDAYADFVITNEDDKAGKAILYMYQSFNGGEKWWKPSENPEVFPIVKIIAGNSNKEFKA